MTASLCHLATLSTHLDVAVVLPVVQPLGDLRPARHLGPQRGDLGGGRPGLPRRPRRRSLVLVTELSQVPARARRGPDSEQCCQMAVKVGQHWLNPLTMNVLGGLSPDEPGLG